MTSVPPLAPAASEPELPEPPFAPGPVEELLRLVVKAARAHQLYLPNNPIYRGAIDALRGGFAPIWAEAGELVLAIGETEIRWFGTPVYGDGTKSSDNLAWLFYKDGVRELRMEPGFEDQEVVKFLELIQRARKGSPDEDDLVTMLWEAELGFLRYRYIDLLSEGGGGEDVADGGDATQPPSPDAVREAAEQAVEESRANGVVSMADFDSTLYFLDPREIEYLQDEITREYEQDLRASVVSTLLDIFEQQNDAGVRAEVLENLQTLMVYLLTSGHFRGVSHLLREARLAADRAQDVTDDQKWQLANLSDRLSAPDALSQLLQALDDAPVTPAREELVDLFDQLRPSALATVFEWLPRTQNDRVRPLLEAAAERLASANTTELVRLIGASAREVSNEAIRRAGALKTQAAVLALSKVVAEPDAARRLIAVQALSEIGSPGALQALERAVDDADREVRVTALRALMSRAYRPVLGRLEAAVRGKAVRDADLTEKMVFFEAYGALCGDDGVPHLDGILNGKGFLGRREDSEIRACAAIALGRVGTSKAQEALRRASAEKDVVVRNAVSRALRGTGASA